MQLPVSALIDRIPKISALLLCAGLFAASSATLLLTDSFVGLLVAFTGFFTLAEMILEVAGPALAAEIAPIKLRGTYLSLFGTCFGFSYGISPLVAGPLLQAELPDIIWTIQLLASGGAAAGLLALASLRRRRETYSTARRTIIARSSRGASCWKARTSCLIFAARMVASLF